MKDVKQQQPTGMLAYIVAAREMKCKSVHSKCLLLYYASNTNNDGTFFKSTTDICAETGLSDRFVRDTNAKWKEIRILSWEQGDWRIGTANRYKLHLDVLRAHATKGRKEIDAAKQRIRKLGAERLQRWREKQKKVTEPGTVTKE